MNSSDTESPQVAGYGRNESSGTNGPVTVDIEPTADSVATVVVEAVARRSGRDPLSLPPLHTAIDCDALDGLFGLQKGATRAMPEHLSVQFEYAGHTVTVADRQVFVTENGA